MLKKKVTRVEKSLLCLSLIDEVIDSGSDCLWRVKLLVKVERDLAFARYPDIHTEIAHRS
jgi:hypothetical protein